MTGRKGRVVSNEDGGVSYESRSELDVPLEILNLTEKQRFMDGEKVSFLKNFFVEHYIVQAISLSFPLFFFFFLFFP